MYRHCEHCLQLTPNHLSSNFCFPLSAPPPTNVRGIYLSKNSLQIFWDAVSASQLTSSLSGYTVTLQEVENPSWTRSIPVSPVSSNVRAYSLGIYTNYSVQVYGRLASVNGISSDPIYVSTDESGKHGLC